MENAYKTLFNALKFNQYFVPLPNDVSDLIYEYLDEFVIVTIPHHLFLALHDHSSLQFDLIVTKVLEITMFFYLTIIDDAFEVVCAFDIPKHVKTLHLTWCSWFTHHRMETKCRWKADMYGMRKSGNIHLCTQEIANIIDTPQDYQFVCRPQVKHIELYEKPITIPRVMVYHWKLEKLLKPGEGIWLPEAIINEHYELTIAYNMRKSCIHVRPRNANHHIGYIKTINFSISGTTGNFSKTGYKQLEIPIPQELPATIVLRFTIVSVITHQNNCHAISERNCEKFNISKDEQHFHSYRHYLPS